MEQKLIAEINRKQEKKRPKFSVGDRVAVSVRLKEGDKERVQIFRGIVIMKHPKSGQGPGAMFTVRKISEGVGVERIFPVHSPFIEKIDVETSSDVRRSRLYYLRNLTGKRARLKEADRFGDLVVAKPAAEAVPTETEIPVEAVATEEAKPEKK